MVWSGMVWKGMVRYGRTGDHGNLGFRKSGARMRGNSAFIVIWLVSARLCVSLANCHVT